MFGIPAGSRQTSEQYSAFAWFKVSTEKAVLNVDKLRYLVVETSLARIVPDRHIEIVILRILARKTSVVDTIFDCPLLLSGFTI